MKNYYLMGIIDTKSRSCMFLGGDSGISAMQSILQLRKSSCLLKSTYHINSEMVYSLMVSFRDGQLPVEPSNKNREPTPLISFVSFEVFVVIAQNLLIVRDNF